MGTRLRALTRRPLATLALAVALGAGVAAVVQAADPRLDEADQALQKASALVEASQTGPSVPPVPAKVEKEFDRHKGRAIELIERARAEIQAAKDVADGAAGP